MIPRMYVYIYIYIYIYIVCVYVHTYLLFGVYNKFFAQIKFWSVSLWLFSYIILVEDKSH
jgi:hypothetical protein